MAKKSTAETKESPRLYPKIADRRLEQLRFTMEDLKVDAMVVTYLPNIRYLTNFSGSAATLFILPEEMHFITDDRYAEQIKTELFPFPNMKTHITRDPWNMITDNKILNNIPTLGFEADRMAYSTAVNIRNVIRPIKFKPAPCGIEPFTIPKSPEELENIQKACDIAVQVYEKILGMIKPGVSEREIAIEIAYQSRILGSENDPFDIIALTGPHACLVHGKPGDRRIHKNDIVLLDFGCRVNGFISDISRTICVGKPTKEQKSIYKLLYDSLENAIQTVRPGMNGKTVDSAARSMITKAGYGENFQHSLGHGIGLEAHEMPTITFRLDDQIVPEDAALAIEPGIYIPDKFGMRIEDNIVVTRNGGRRLTKAPDDLISV
ncbi:MAG: Aminopeptidase family protein [Bacteroidota bacterium]|nr:Aminopeptidase family protein [Bacteroidota bacterium]